LGLRRVHLVSDNVVIYKLTDLTYIPGPPPACGRHPLAEGGMSLPYR
jgi:hypothetical protein